MVILNRNVVKILICCNFNGNEFIKAITSNALEKMLRKTKCLIYVQKEIIYL